MVKKIATKFELRKKCAAYLGKAGRYWFMEFLALSQPRTLAKVSSQYASLPKRGASELVVWTKALLPVLPMTDRRTANGDDGLKALVSNWQEIQRGHVDRKAEQGGLAFTVSCTKLSGRGEQRKWKGSLILIYEGRTQSLFHHIIDLGSDSKIPPELIWFALSQAMKAVAKRELPSELCTGPRTIMFPTNLMGCNINHTFQEAAAMFESARIKQTTLRVVWKKQHEAIFDTNLWILKSYIGRAHLPLQIESNKVGDVASELRKISGTVTAFIRREMKKKSKPSSISGDAIAPSWQALNTERVQIRKDPLRFQR